MMKKKQYVNCKSTISEATKQELENNDHNTERSE